MVDELTGQIGRVSNAEGAIALTCPQCGYDWVHDLGRVSVRTDLKQEGQPLLVDAAGSVPPECPTCKQGGVALVRGNLYLRMDDER